MKKGFPDQPERSGGSGNTADTPFPISPKDKTDVPLMRAGCHGMGP